MGFPFFVSLPDDARPLTQPENHEENPLYAKHVELYETKPCVASYKRVDNSLFISHLLSSCGSAALEQLMVVKFPSNNKNFIIDTLKKGIECNGSQYNYLGQSYAQLRNKTCFMIDASLNDIHSLLAKFDNFDDIFPVARRAQKISLLFSPFSRSLELRDDEFDVTDDVTSTLGTYVFTDGCGLMSPELAKEVQTLYNLSQAPSVVEVRFKHFRGVLVHCTEMPSPQVKALFRHSMADFAAPLGPVSEVNTLGIVDYSQPYSLGYLDTQTVMLLAEGGVPREHLETLQEDYHEMLQRLEDKTYASYFLRTTGNEKLLQSLNKDGLTEDIVKELKNLKATEIKNIIRCEKIVKDDEENEGECIFTQDDEEAEIDESECKPRETDALIAQDSSTKNVDTVKDNNMNQVIDFKIFMPDSRVVYGVSDPYGQLNYGECFFQPTLHKAESDAFAVAEAVVVIRRPSFHVGDVRVLKLAQGKEDYKDLYDCIVFPTRGSRPHAIECGGGRVGGEKYCVCWDQGLIPRYISSPYPYISFASASSSRIANKVKELAPSFKCMKKKPATDTEERKSHQQARQELVEHFANFKDYEELRSHARNLFLKYASLSGSTCRECELLKKMLVREFDWSERYEQVAKKLDELEEAHEKEIEVFTKSPDTDQLSSQPARSLGVWDRLLISMQWKKPAFCPGDDIWNQMKARSVDFVASQTNT